MFKLIRPRHRGAPVIDGARARNLVAGGALLVDVRSPGEFADGHVDGAINIPVQELDRRFAELGDPAATVVVYCRSGMRSAKAGSALQQHGFTDVYDLGPMSAW